MSVQKSLEGCIIRRGFKRFGLDMGLGLVWFYFIQLYSRQSLLCLRREL